ncbi:MAG: hypothetical protein AAF289_08600 [Cyanobacteria bacterium P01_A01_bin.135]
MIYERQDRSDAAHPDSECTNAACQFTSGGNPEDPDSLVHIIIGPLHAINTCRHELYLRGYAEANEWSEPMRMVNTAQVLRSQHPNNMMRVLSKRVIPSSPQP